MHIKEYEFKIVCPYKISKLLKKIETIGYIVEADDIEDKPGLCITISTPNNQMELSFKIWTYEKKHGDYCYETQYKNKKEMEYMEAVFEKME